MSFPGVPVSVGCALEKPLVHQNRQDLKRLPAQDSCAIKPLLRWAFYGFVFSLPFETLNLGVPLEPPAIFGGLLVIATVLHPHLFWRWPPGAFWCFVIYLYVCLTLGALEFNRYPVEFVWQLLVLIQLVILCWIAFNLMLYERVARTALLVLVASCATLALFQLAGITATASDVSMKVERVSALGFHPNNIARILSLGLLALIGLTYGALRSAIQPRILAWPAMAVIGMAIVQTGSRGGLVAFALGVLTFLLKSGTVWTKFKNTFAVLFIIGCLAWVALYSESMRARFERTLEDGDLARREEIFPNAIQMFREKPLIGWGTVASTYELGSRLGHLGEESKNPHNLILHALISTGLLGAIPLFAGIGLAARGAWRARHGARGILPFAMVVTVLAANLSGLWLFNKMHWLVIAYALASGNLARSRLRHAGQSELSGRGEWLRMRRPLASASRAFLGARVDSYRYGPINLR